MKVTISFILIISAIFFIVPQEDVFGEETKGLVYFDIEKNNELVKEEISNAFWENPLNTPPFLIIIGIGIGMIVVVWKRKWYNHENKTNTKL